MMALFKRALAAVGYSRQRHPLNETDFDRAMRRWKRMLDD